MPGKQLWTNNANTTLSVGYGPANTSIVVVWGAGFPIPASPDFFLATIESAAASPKLHEIVKVTDRSGNTFTIVRAQESTTAKSWSSGDIVSLRTTAGSLQALQSFNPDVMAFAASH